MPYQQTSLAANLSTLVGLIETQHQMMRQLERGTVAPTIVLTGLLWNRTDHPSLGEAIMRWDGSAWQVLIDPEFKCLNSGGTVLMDANFSMNTHKILFVGDGTDDTDGVNLGQVVLRDGSNWMTGDLDLDGNEILDVGPPSLSTSAARLAEVRASKEGLFFYDQFCKLLTTVSATSWEDVGWVPRIVEILLHGEVRLLSDDTLIGSVDQLTFRHLRWEGDTVTTPDYPGTGGTALVGYCYPYTDAAPWPEFTVGSTACYLELTFKYDIGPVEQGFWLALRRSSDNALLKCQVVQCHAMVGYGQ